MIPVRIQLRSIPGGWRASVGHTDGRPAETDLPDDRMHEMASQIADLLRPPPVALDDARRSRKEEAATQVLGSLLAAPATQAALHGLLGEARGRGVRALLLIDAPEQPARSLPWELLGDHEAFEGRGEAVVARLVEGRVTEHALADDFTVLIAAPDPTDPLVAARLIHLRALLDQLGIAHLPAGDPVQGSTVLHLVAHGGVADAESMILLPHGNQGAGTLAHRLTPLLKQAGLVVLDVCDAGHTGSDESQIPGARLVQAGAPAVIAPTTRCGLDAAKALSEGLYTALAAGNSVGDSVAEGRRSVRALGRAHPDSRWTNAVLHVAGPAAAMRALTRCGWRPEGWGPVEPEVAALLDRARKLATPHGFVGVEHLLSAWPDTGGRTWSSHLRYILAHRPDPRACLGALHAKSGRLPDFSGSPRLKRHRPDRLDLEGFARWMWNELDGVIQALFDLPAIDEQELSLSGSTLDPVASSTRAPRAQATGLEMLGGPEDGLRFSPPLDLGRATPSGAGLYATTMLIDPYLSRQALHWHQGPELLKGASRLVSGTWHAHEPGPIDLRAGDQLRLTGGTRIRAL